MLRMICVCLVFGGCTLCGLHACARLRDRARLLQALRADIRRLTLLMAYSAQPLATLARRVADGRAALFWNLLAGELPRAQSVRSAWEQAMREAGAQDAAFLALGEPERTVLLDYAAGLGASGQHTQGENARLLEERLHTVAREAQEEYVRKGRMYRTMGVLCGAAAAILVL